MEGMGITSLVAINRESGGGGGGCPAAGLHFSFL